VQLAEIAGDVLARVFAGDEGVEIRGSRLQDELVGHES
jgi:hypothetical protein